MDTPTVDVSRAVQLVEEGALLLDVREDDEWQAGHAPTATHIPLSILGQELGRLDRNQPIVAVCRVGGRSERAAGVLLQRGYDAVNLAGGMQAWHAAGMPVVTDAGEPGDVI